VDTQTAPACTWVASLAASHFSALSNDCWFVHWLSRAALSVRCARRARLSTRTWFAAASSGTSPEPARATAVCP